MLGATTVCISISIGTRFSGHKVTTIEWGFRRKFTHGSLMWCHGICVKVACSFQCCSCFRFTPCWRGGFLWLVVSVNFMLSSGGFLTLLRKWSLKLYFRWSFHEQGYRLIRKRLGKWEEDHLGLPLPQDKIPMFRSFIRFSKVVLLICYSVFK